MVKFVDQQLTQLRNEVYRMWAMVYSQMDQARQAVLAMDRNIAQQIWVRERLVDAQDIKIDTQVEDFIALYTPVAVDLRFVLAMLKINSDLERPTASPVSSRRQMWRNWMRIWWTGFSWRGCSVSCWR